MDLLKRERDILLILSSPDLIVTGARLRKFDVDSVLTLLRAEYARALPAPLSVPEREYIADVLLARYRQRQRSGSVPLPDRPTEHEARRLRRVSDSISQEDPDRRR